MANYVIKFGIFLMIILLVGAAVTLAAWGLWIMFVAWFLNADFHRQLIIATSGFWIITGGMTWAILRSRKS